MITAERDEEVYMKSDTKIEPLSCGWYTWGHLVLPTQHAINIAFRQLSILKSFVANPSVHEAAHKDLTLLSAPFVKLKSDDKSRVSDLIADATKRCGHLIKFAEDLLSLVRQLQQSASGFSLEQTYKKIPSSLAGLVELTYDLDNRAGLRIFEELTLCGELDNSATQEIALFRMRDRDRSFFLNTPRLPTSERMILQLPFAGKQFDILAMSRIRPVSSVQLLRELRVLASSQERFLEFCTRTPAPRDRPHYSGEDVRVRYFGHACVLVQSSKVSILIDPLLVCGHEEPEATLVFDDLPDFIDYVFITHNHQDHFCPEILLQLRTRIGRILVPRNNPQNLADPSMKLTLKALGFDNVTVMDALDRETIPDGEIVSLPFYGEHADLSICSKHAMYLQLKGRTLVFLADSNCLDRMLYRRLMSHLSKVDMLFIGMECEGAPLSWLYSPYLLQPVKRKDDESRRLCGSDSERAWSAIEEINCSRVFVYAMGQEPWLKYLCGLQYTAESKQIVESNKLVERCRSAGIPAERLYGCREMML